MDESAGAAAVARSLLLLAWPPEQLFVSLWRWGNNLKIKYINKPHCMMWKSTVAVAK